MVPAPTIVLAVIHRATVTFPTPKAPPELGMGVGCARFRRNCCLEGDDGSNGGGGWGQMGRKGEHPAVLASCCRRRSAAPGVGCNAHTWGSTDGFYHPRLLVGAWTLCEWGRASKERERVGVQRVEHSDLQRGHRWGLCV
ncbi:hypothetical protein BD779DRAFT_1547833 [Infundibulicybe gibba]|nr:hypothetical protein BD779DRAFT_1547833 [Infundibulicybe gibba]